MDVHMSEKHTVTVRGSEARAALLAGATAIADVVATTMGPAGSTVIIRDHAGKTVATKDGATVSASIRPKSIPEAMGADIVRAASEKTAERAGDGTSTCAVIAAAMMKQANKALTANVSQMSLRREFAPACSKLLSQLRKQARPVRDESELKRVALIASNGDDALASAVTEAVVSAGSAGKIQLTDAEAGPPSTTVTDGVFVRAEILSGHFANVTGKLACAGDDALIIVSRGKLSSFDGLLNVMRAAAEKRVALVLLFTDFEQSAFQALVENRSRGALNVFACKLGRVSYDEVTDIASAVGASPFDADGRDEAVCGHLKRFCADKKGLSVVPADKNLPPAVATELCARAAESHDPRERAALLLRAASLASKHAVVAVSAPTQAELTEIRHRAEDAIAACRAAAEAGVTRGAGAALLDALSETDLSEFSKDTAEILRAGAEAPLSAILMNAGKSLDWFGAVRKSKSDVYDAAADAITSSDHIVDCALAPITALESAASAVRTFIATSAIVYEEDVELPKK